MSSSMNVKPQSWHGVASERGQPKPIKGENENFFIS